MEITQDYILTILTEAYQTFLERDIHLINVNTNERSLTHRIAVYLEWRFPQNYSVDCEYSRNGNDIKVLPSYRGNRTGEVLPDIIVHERWTINNLLVIEAKKDEDWVDRDKLAAYINDLWYQFAVLMKFPRNLEVENISDNIIFI